MKNNIKFSLKYFIRDKEIFDNFKNSLPSCLNLDQVTYFLDNDINWPEHC